MSTPVTWGWFLAFELGIPVAWAIAKLMIHWLRNAR